MKILKGSLLFLISGLALADFIPPLSEGLTSLPSAEEQIKTYLGQQVSTGIPGRVEIEVRTPVSLKSCAQPLELHSHRSSAGQWMGQIMVEARCAQPSQSWSSYVPAKIRLFQSALVTTHPLMAGTTLTDTDVTFQEVDLSEQTPGITTQSEELIGKQLKHNMTPGQVITLRDIKSPQMVHKQELVNVTAKINQLSVAINAEALDDGALGELVRIKNLQSNRIVQGVVVGPQAVEIPQRP